MTVRTGTTSDLEQVMKIETLSFSKSIQETQETFLQRITLSPETFLLFIEDSQTNPKIAGYLTAEFISKIPVHQEELALNHKCKNKKTSIIYISSFALLPEYRGKGNGEKSFKTALNYLKENFNPSIIILLVNQKWQGACHIYEKSGFIKINTFKNFFPDDEENSFNDGLLMKLEVVS